MLKTNTIIAIQMDEFEKIRYASDSTILFARELQKHNYQIFCYTPANLRLENNQLKASGQYVEFFDNEDHYYEVIRSDVLDLENTALVLIRQNPPFNMDYITTTYLLEKLQGKTVVLNDPKEIRNNPEKLMIYNFPDHVLPSIIAEELVALIAFYNAHQDVIIKPLYDFGGNAVKRITSLEQLQTTLPDYLQKHKKIIMQKFLPAIFKGDKRVLMADGQIVGAFRKVPAMGKVTSNLVAGGKAEHTELTSQEMEICRAVGKFLNAKNLFLAGIDILDGYLLEINITSPTGFKAYNQLYNVAIEKQIIHSLVKRIP
jgi:glutathione synthase